MYLSRHLVDSEDTGEREGGSLVTTQPNARETLPTGPRRQSLFSPGVE